MSILEFFRADHGREQINKQQERDDTDDDRFHFVLLQLLAKTHVKSAGDEKRNDDTCKNEIAHRFSLGCSQKRE
jgi:hypothetical protein